MASGKEKKKRENEKPDSEMLRRFKSNPFIFIGSFVILIIVIIAFVMPSTLGMEHGRGFDLTFGYYDRVPINYVPGNFFAQYHDMVSRWRQNQMDGDNFSFVNYQIWRESFEATVIHTAMLQEMKRSGYSVPARVVDREVARLPHFQENGRFSPALYRRMDENSRMTLWRQVQDDIVKDRFRSDVTGLSVPSSESEFIGRMGALQRSFSVAVFNVDDYPDEEYEAYFYNNAGLFSTIHLSMMTVGSEREARRIFEQIENGYITFEDAARAHSRDFFADRGGDMGVRAVHELRMDIPDEAARERALSLDSGEYSEIIRTASGWHIFRAEDSVREADISDPAFMDRVRFYMRNFERGRMEDWAIGQADDFIAQANEIGFDEAVAGLNVESRTFGPVPINFGNVDLFTSLASQPVAEVSGAATDENFWRIAFSTPINTPSQPVVRGSNILVLFPTEEIEEEDVIENVVSMVESWWLDHISEQSLNRFFLNSPRMEDNFMDVYFRLFMP